MACVRWLQHLADVNIVVQHCVTLWVYLMIVLVLADRVSNSAPVHRNPGMALVYSELPFNVPAVFKRLVESWGVHSIVVFLTVRQVRASGWEATG